MSEPTPDAAHPAEPGWKEELSVLLRRVQAADRFRDDFLAIITHGLRTPLNTILMSAQLLQMRKTNDLEVNEAAGIIIDSVKALGRLIEEQSDIARIVAGQVILKCKPLDLADAATAALAAAASAAHDKGVTLEPPVLCRPAPLEADPTRVSQILKNLLTNAIEYTPAGGKVNVTLERSATHYSLAITDTGRGLSPEALASLFDLARPRETTAPRTRRTLGVGLAVVHRLVEMHKGTIEAHSEGLGRGATFVVNLPIAAALPTSST
jgi:signal transduction histidine kinase